MAARKAGQRRVPSAGTKARTDPGPVTSPARTRPHAPVTPRTVPAAITDKSSAATGSTIFEKAAVTQRRTGRGSR